MITNEAVFTENRKRTIRKSQENYKTAETKYDRYYFVDENGGLLSKYRSPNLWERVNGAIRGLHQVSTKAKEDYSEQVCNLLNRFY